MYCDIWHCFRIFIVDFKQKFAQQAENWANILNVEPENKNIILKEF